MPFPLASSPVYGGSHPTPAYAGTFIPELWSTKLLVNFYANTLLRRLVSFDYENEIKRFGDTIRIRTIPNTTIRTYSVDGALAVDRYGAPVVTMTIDKGKYFSTIIDDIYKAQSDIDLFRMLTEAFSNDLRVEIETDFFAGIIADPAAGNYGNAAGVKSGNVKLGATGSPLQVTLSPSSASQVDPVHLLLRLNQVLMEQNVPPDGNWWIVVPPWFAQMLKPSDLKSASDMGDERSVLRTGVLGRIDNSVVYVSNLLPRTNEGGTWVTTIYAGHPYAINFATQLQVVEEMRNPTSFGTLLRGLQVYGYKTTKPQALAKAYAYGAL
jgi:hypothetical protein